MEETIPFKNLHSREYQGHKKKVFFNFFFKSSSIFFFGIKKKKNLRTLALVFFFGLKGTFGSLEL